MVRTDTDNNNLSHTALKAFEKSVHTGGGYNSLVIQQYDEDIRRLICDAVHEYSSEIGRVDDPIGEWAYREWDDVTKDENGRPVTWGVLIANNNEPLKDIDLFRELIAPLDWALRELNISEVRAAYPYQDPDTKNYLWEKGPYRYSDVWPRVLDMSPDKPIPAEFRTLELDIDERTDGRFLYKGDPAHRWLGIIQFLFDGLAGTMHWNDCCTTCSGCMSVVNTEPTSYFWLPEGRYFESIGEYLCLICVQSIDSYALEKEIDQAMSDSVPCIGSWAEGPLRQNEWVSSDTETTLDVPSAKDLIARMRDVFPVGTLLCAIDPQQFQTGFSIWIHPEDLDDLYEDEEDPDPLSRTFSVRATDLLQWFKSTPAADSILREMPPTTSVNVRVFWSVPDWDMWDFDHLKSIFGTLEAFERLEKGQNPSLFTPIPFSLDVPPFRTSSPTGHLNFILNARFKAPSAQEK